MHDAPTPTRSARRGGKRARLRPWWVRTAVATSTFAAYGAIAAPAFAWPGCAC